MQKTILLTFGHFPCAQSKSVLTCLSPQSVLTCLSPQASKLHLKRATKTHRLDMAFSGFVTREVEPTGHETVLRSRRTHRVPASHPSTAFGGVGIPGRDTAGCSLMRLGSHSLSIMEAEPISSQRNQTSRCQNRGTPPKLVAFLFDFHSRRSKYPIFTVFSSVQGDLSIADS